MRTVVVQWKEDVGAAAMEEAGFLLQGGGGGGEEGGGTRRTGGGGLLLDGCGGGGGGVAAAFARRSAQFPLKAWLRETVHHRDTMETLIRLQTFLECLTNFQIFT